METPLSPISTLPMSLAAAMRIAAEATAQLAAATCYKALLVRFAELAKGAFGVDELIIVRIVTKEGRIELEPRSIKLSADAAIVLSPPEGVAALGDSIRSLVASRGRQALRELRDGFTQLTTARGDDIVIGLEDPRSSQGSLVAFSASCLGRAGAAQRADHAALLEVLVRQLQAEARWHRRLDKTQALLYRDDLTGLYNTRYFEIALDTELRRAQRFAAQFCILFIDLDGFKPINDTHGHPSGSSVLRQVADVLRDAVREIDILIRYGGDEFVVMLLGATSSKGVLAAERIRRKIEQREFTLEDGGTAHLTCSIGVASFPEHGKDRKSLLEVADATMYDSKRRGKNRVTLALISPPESR